MRRFNGTGRLKMAIDIGSATQAAPGREDCGNRCGWWVTATRVVMAMVQSQGGSAEPAHAAEIALASIGARLARPLDEFFSTCNIRLRETHGVAMAVAVVDLGSGHMSMAAVGNIHTLLLSPNEDYRLVGTAGIVGRGFDSLATKSYTLAAGDTLMLLTDGMQMFPVPQRLLKTAALSSALQARAMVERWGKLDGDAAALIYRHTA